MSFLIVSGVSNMRYLKAHQIALDHQEREREREFFVNVDSDGRDLEESWVQEDVAKLIQLA